MITWRARAYKPRESTHQPQTGHHWASREHAGALVLILGEQHLRTVLVEYQTHYNTARPHQGIAQHVLADECATHPTTVTDVEARQIRRKPVLNGLINEYAPAA